MSLFRKKKKRQKRKNPNLFETFTKVWVSVLLIIAVIDLQLTYVLALLGRGQIAETLSVAIVTEILGVTIAYLIRAYLDSKNEAKNELERKKLDMSTNEEAIANEYVEGPGEG